MRKIIILLAMLCVMGCGEKADPIQELRDAGYQHIYGGKIGDLGPGESVEVTIEFGAKMDSKEKARPPFPAFEIPDGTPLMSEMTEEEQIAILDKMLSGPPQQVIPNKGDAGGSWNV